MSGLGFQQDYESKCFLFQQQLLNVAGEKGGIQQLQERFPFSQYSSIHWKSLRSLNDVKFIVPACKKPSLAMSSAVSIECFKQRKWTLMFILTYLPFVM